MNTAEGGISGCLPKVVNYWQSFWINLRNPIHPLDPIVPPNNEFILVDRKIQIRVIHYVSDNVQKPPIPEADCTITNSKRSSLSEEYWFTKWNRPLKIGNCNCSFRRSLRYSLLSTQSAGNNKRFSTSSFDLVPKRIVNVETFVERIIQETLKEAFQEYYMLKNKITNINYAFEDDEFNNIVLRHKENKNKVQKSSSNNNNNNNTNSINSKHQQQCIHKKNSQRNKPLVMLFHGIGTTADIWRLIINAFIYKGYEVVAPDILGHGYSSAPDKSNYYEFHNLLIQAITIFDHYLTDDNRKCILIGHSYGCSIVTALYQHRAPQITQLILISGGGPTPLAAPVKNNEISPFGCIHTLLKPFLYCGLKRSFLFSSRGKHFESSVAESGIPPHILKYIIEGQNWPEGDAAFHRRILVPTLLVHGLQDKQVTLVQQCEMERTIPRAFLELIPNAGHLSMLEAPEHLTHMILCFIETWS